MTPPSHALIVDDEPDICELLELTLGRMNIETRAANDLAQARELLAQYRFDLCLTDMKLPDGKQRRGTGGTHPATLPQNPGGDDYCPRQHGMGYQSAQSRSL